MTTREILIAARKRIEKPENWNHCTGTGDCAGMAMYHVTNECHDADLVFMNANGIPTGKKHWGIYHWNDAPERTHAEVLAAFDRAIAATPEPAHDAALDYLNFAIRKRE